jgi:aryl-alcohol dehydrogenase-like predicted oxidoreductase
MTPRSTSSLASTDVPTRQLGATAIRVSEIGFGTWAIGGDGGGTLAYGPADDDESREALNDAHTRGCTFFDTSNLYGWGHAETLLGQALADVRAGVVIATKAGYVTASGEQDFSSDAVRRSLDNSLVRLRTAHVDLLQLHNPAPEALAGSEALFVTLDALTRDGTIRALGISARTPDEALLFATRYRPATLQVNFNLADLRALRNGLFDACRERGIGLIVRTPLAAGFLTGEIAASETFGPGDHRGRYDAVSRARWADAVQRLRPLFDDVPEATPAQNAIRFCLSFDAVSAVIPGMMRAAEVRENLAASRLPRLDSARLDAVGAIYDELFG